MPWWLWVLIGVVVVILFLTGLVLLQYMKFRRYMPRPGYQPAAHRPDIASWPHDEVRVTWIGHSTLYIQMFDVGILTDPVFSPRVGVKLFPGLVIGPKRFTGPALTARDLKGRVDLMLLSHAHLDHLDRPSIRALASPDTEVVMPRNTSHLVTKYGFRNVTEVGGAGHREASESHASQSDAVTPAADDGDQSHATAFSARGDNRRMMTTATRDAHVGSEWPSITTEKGVKVTVVPVRHWGARFPWNRSYQWTGYLIEYRGVRILFPGDTAFTHNFAKLRTEAEPARHDGSTSTPPIDIAFMPIGAYAPERFQGAHCTPEQAWEMFEDTGARYMIPIHWNTFVLSMEPVHEPLERLRKAAGGQSEQIVMGQQGETFVLPTEDHTP